MVGNLFHHCPQPKHDYLRGRARHAPLTAIYTYTSYYRYLQQPLDRTGEDESGDS